MADLSDVTATLASIIATTLYPVAPTSVTQVSAAAGVPVRIEVGWPNPQTVDKDKKCGVTSVSIYPLQTERNTTRYPKEWLQMGPLSTPTFTLVQSGQTVTVGGTGSQPYFPQNLAVFVGGQAYIAAARETATPESIAADLGNQITIAFPGTTVSGARISLPDGAVIGALRVGTAAPVAKEVRRQTRTIQVMVLSPTPTARDAVVRAFDPLLADMPRISLPDGFGARLLYRGSPFNDFDQKFGLFRRDVLYDIEYPTILTDTGTEAIALRTDVSAIAPDGSPISPPIISPTA